jgi:hypothetical protein
LVENNRALSEDSERTVLSCAGEMLCAFDRVNVFSFLFSASIVQWLLLVARAWNKLK